VLSLNRSMTSTHHGVWTLVSFPQLLKLRSYKIILPAGFATCHLPQRNEGPKSQAVAESCCEYAVKHDCVFGVPDWRISEIELVSKVPSSCKFCDTVGYAW
jgi:hypothetical protein